MAKEILSQIYDIFDSASGDLQRSIDKLNNYMPLEELLRRKVPPQDTYNFVAKHIIEQGEKYGKSKDSQGCCYRTLSDKDEGYDLVLKCAVGCVIPEEYYHKNYEGHMIKSLTLLIKYGRFLGHDISLLEQLQSLHDDWDMCQWEQRFKEIADKFNLNHEILNNYQIWFNENQYERELNG